MFKTRNWSYENEWRLIQKDSPGYLQYDKDELLGVILGHNMNRKYMSEIKKACKSKGIPILKTLLMRPQAKIIFVPLNIDNDEYISFSEILEKIDGDKYTEKEQEFFHIVNRNVFCSL